MKNAQQYSSRPPLREQIAQQPPAQSLQHSASGEPTARMGRPEPRAQSRTRPDPLRMKRTTEKERVESVSPQQDIANKPVQASLSATDSVSDIVQLPVPPPPATRELRVKVWPQEEAALTDMLQPVAVPQVEEEQPTDVAVQTEEAEQPADVASQMVEVEEEQPADVASQMVEVEEEQPVDNTVENLPTRPLGAPTELKPPVQPVAAPPSASTRRANATDDIAQILTVPLSAPQSMVPAFPANRSTAYSGQRGQRPGIGRDTIDNPSLPASRVAQPVTPPGYPAVRPQPQPQSARPYNQGPASPVPSAAPIQRRMPSPISPFPPVASAQERMQTPPIIPVQSDVSPASMASRRNARRTKRVPLLLGFVVLVVLLVAALGSWIVVRQPFSVAPVTQPQQAFANSRLGLSLLYPSGWTAKVDQTKQSVYFSDSSHTGQVTIMVTAASGDVGQYLRTEAAQLGMTAVKPGTALSFAGTSWQEMRGNVQQAGANYAAVLLATTHGGHIYMILQMAPPPVYSQEDQLTFSSMRSSFHFLS